MNEVPGSHQRQPVISAGAAASIAAQARTRLADGDLAGVLALLRRERRRHASLGVALAECLLLFVGDPASIEEAVAALTEAEADDPAAGYLLAWLALGGRALPLDLAAIGARLARAAAAGHQHALRAIALAQLRCDPERGEGSLERAMLGGDPIAGLLLAERWRRAEGFLTDRKRLALLDAQLDAAGFPPLPPIEVRHADPVASSGEALEGFLRIPDGQLLAEGPRIERFDELLSADECRFLIAMARPLLKRSTVHDPSLGIAATLPVRTSSDAAFDLIHEDAAMRLVLLRLARAARAEPAHAEPLIVLNYRPGEAYLPHRDYLAPAALATSHPEFGQRRTTVCAYLNTVEEGGRTIFPDLGVESVAIGGAAIVFDNLTTDGLPEPRSLHAGEAVRRGQKWLATLWLRERPIRSI